MQETSFSPPKSHSEGLEAAAAWLTPPPPQHCSWTTTALAGHSVNSVNLLNFLDPYIWKIIKSKPPSHPLPAAASKD